MEIAFYVLLGLIAGCAAMYLFAVRRARQNAGLLEAKERELDALRTDFAALDAKFKMLDEDAADWEAQAKRLQQSATELTAQNEAQKTELAMLRQQQSEEREQRERDRLEQTERFREQLQSAQQQMQLLARQVLESNAEKLKSGNAEHIGHITQPLKEQIEQMRRAIDQQKQEAAGNVSAMKEQISQLMNSTHDIGQKTERLTSALKGESKTQGDWGEVILGDLLESQGLVEGRQFDTQITLRDEHGAAIRNAESDALMRPDVILHYPQNQDVIIDAKVSLRAFMDYQNADSDAERADALKRHIASVRDQMKGLARRDYSAYVVAPRKAIDFVVMFVPNEAALQLALQHDKALWNDAFEKKVLITGEQNLLTILRTIGIVWKQYQQAQNQQHVYKVADELVKRCAMFLEAFEGVGKKLNEAQRAFDETAKRVRGSRTSIEKSARQLIELGAKDDANHPLPLFDEESESDQLTTHGDAAAQ